ncbi:MAG: penicillin-binding protein 2 [Acidobacteriota bacterium]
MAEREIFDRLDDFLRYNPATSKRGSASSYSRKSQVADGFSFDLRAKFILYLVFAIFVILGIRFYNLQIAKHEMYVQRAENNRIREIPIIAARGAILDRNEKVLVDSTPINTVVIMPEDIVNKQDTIDALVNNLGINREDVEKELNNPKRSKIDPILIKQNTTYADRAWIEAHQLEHPEIILDEQPQRIYKFGKTACHVIGYVGQVSAKQLENESFQKAGYKMGDIIGQGGVEATYDKILRGQDGVRRVIVDSRGRKIRELDIRPPIRGQDVVLSLDLDIQRVAEEEFERTQDKGAAIALDPRNGEIIAMVSYPNFDPNVFARNIVSPENRKEVAAILTDPGHPLNNKAIQGYYPAGSTWKLMMSTAAIEAGVTPLNNSRLVCGGGLQVGGRFIHCMGSHGAPDVHTAIVRSCDGYYYRLGVKMGVDRMREWLLKFGMGQKTGIDLPHERIGSIPSRDWKARTFPRTPEWNDFDSALAGIGQGSVAIPPLQLIRAESGIMMDGHFFTPHVFKEAKATEAMPVKYYEDSPREITLSAKTTAAIRYAVWGVVNEGGTAGGIGFPRELNVGGKTGTAQVIAKEKAKGKHLQDHSWFISFAPVNEDMKPEFAVVCFTENGGFGAKASGPKAKAIHTAYFAKRDGKFIPAEEIAKNATTGGNTLAALSASGVPGQPQKGNNPNTRLAIQGNQSPIEPNQRRNR